MAKINTVLLVPQQLGDFLSNLKGKSLQHATPATQQACAASEKTITISAAKLAQLLQEIRSKADRSKRACKAAIEQSELVIAGCDRLLQDLQNVN
jgi:hypothetical protein